jgi:hypothetical protein
MGKLCFRRFVATLVVAAATGAAAARARAEDMDVPGLGRVDLQTLPAGLRANIRSPGPATVPGPPQREDLPLLEPKQRAWREPVVDRAARATAHAAGAKPTPTGVPRVELQPAAPGTSGREREAAPPEGVRSVRDHVGHMPEAQPPKVGR